MLAAILSAIIGLTAPIGAVNPPEPPLTPAEAVVLLDWTAVEWCAAVRDAVDNGMTPLDAAITGMLNWHATFPDADPVSTAHVHGFLVGCLAA